MIGGLWDYWIKGLKGWGLVALSDFGIGGLGEYDIGALGVKGNLRIRELEDWRMGGITLLGEYWDWWLVKGIGELGYCGVGMLGNRGIRGLGAFGIKGSGD